ncbi:hypothetical protein DHD05_03515 [Arenibacter sp. N53]|uniref:hypothetical protein n=1 Tax=Arenibacter TaxID=178469 RepID=UPI000CD4909B|nr:MULTISPECIES: hypothetical protein [Arenibacter]MCM4150649.1 hypothetical protein [Arenibacter sp. N53]
MKRIQLFEFEDLPWFPSWLRACMTKLIVVLQKMMGVTSVLSNLIADILRSNKIGHIVDLGSGAGGVMPDVLRTLHQDYGLEEVDLTMTDQYPDRKVIASFNTLGENGIRYAEKPLDAKNLQNAPEGLKTMVNCFHHMSPKQARSILKSAERNNQSLLIYEIAENNIPLLIWWLLLPLSLVILMVMVFFMTPFVKPLTWKQLVFTYVIPIIPICYAWDGQASLPRMYTLKDMDILLEGLGSERYGWEKGFVKKANNKKLGTFVLGVPIQIA